MIRVVKNYARLLLKLISLAIGILGIAILLYSLWMIRIWPQDAEDSSIDDHSSLTFPWFIHAFVGIGVTICAITCLGHVAADSANGLCLSIYMAIVFLLLMLETSLIANVFLYSKWEKELPEDPTGRFDDFKEFMRANANICKWIGLMIIVMQGSSILLATILQTLATDHENIYDCEECDYLPNRLPLLYPPF